LFSENIPSGNQVWKLEIPYNVRGGFNWKIIMHWKIIYTWRISHSYVKLPEGIDAVTKVGHIKGTSNIQKQADVVGILMGPDGFY
jgi:hypothetical protein